jgi:hypothetical protein
MRGLAPPEELDRYLRASWLGCCGHLGPFSVGRWGGNEIPKSRRADRGFGGDTEPTHINDFGTEARVPTRRRTCLRDRPRGALHRSDGAEHKPEAVCTACDRETSRLCVECMCDEDASGTPCDEPVEEPPHDAYGEPMPVLNPPCTGMCPAKSPY